MQTSWLVIKRDQTSNLCAYVHKCTQRQQQQQQQLSERSPMRKIKVFSLFFFLSS